MTDSEFIEKVREIISLPQIIPDDSVCPIGYKNDELEYLGGHLSCFAHFKVI